MTCDIGHNHEILNQKGVKKKGGSREKVTETNTSGIHWYSSHKMATAHRITNTKHGGLTETNTSRTPADGGTDAHNETRKEYQYGHQKWRL